MTDREPIDARLIERPFDPTRKRYYMVQGQYDKNIGDYEVVNERDFDTILAGNIPFSLLRQTEMSDIKVFAGRSEDGYDIYYQGPRRFTLNSPAKPLLKVGLRNKILDVYGYARVPYISNRAKQLLESIDPNAFEFRECDAITRNKVKLEPYWQMNVIGLVMEFDEAQSVFREVSAKTGLIPAGQNPCITHMYEALMLPELVNGKHAFWILKYITHYIFDENIVDAWRKEKFTGFEFSPLQPPSKSEFKHTCKYYNRDYFWEGSRKYWEDLV